MLSENSIRSSQLSNQYQKQMEQNLQLQHHVDMLLMELHNAKANDSIHHAEMKEMEEMFKQRIKTQELTRLYEKIETQTEIFSSAKKPNLAEIEK